MSFLILTFTPHRKVIQKTQQVIQNFIALQVNEAFMNQNSISYIYHTITGNKVIVYHTVRGIELKLGAILRG